MILGLMSGTSLDGLDVVAVEFNKQKNSYDFNILHSKTYTYSEEWMQKLGNANTLSGFLLYSMDLEFGKLMADCVLEFISDFKIDKSEIEFISSHGHTIFHQPEKGITLQIGSGHSLAFHSELKVINDFRIKDVLAGGQGAPLVPIGDKFLFQDTAESCLNLGGFANISFNEKEKIRAYDICPANLPINYLVQDVGKKYDDKGELARSGELNYFLLEMLNDLPYYQKTGHKSLGVEWLQNEFYPLIKTDKSLKDNLATITEHIAFQIAKVLTDNKIKSVLITGGGVYNTYLLERITHYYKGEIVLPSREIIEFKEALIFAFLGYLYTQNKYNSLKTITGATKDTINGAYYLP